MPRLRYFWGLSLQVNPAAFAALYAAPAISAVAKLPKLIRLPSSEIRAWYWPVSVRFTPGGQPEAFNPLVSRANCSSLRRSASFRAMWRGSSFRGRPRFPMLQYVLPVA